MFKRFKNIKLKILLTHLIITLAYPAAKAFRAEGNRLLFFTDALTIVGALLIIIGIFYSFALHGDFDRVTYVFHRGFSKNIVKPYEEVQKELKANREDSFNYPLFTGLLFLAVAGVLSAFFY